MSDQLKVGIRIDADGSQAKAEIQSVGATGDQLAAKLGDAGTRGATGLNAVAQSGSASTTSLGAVEKAATSAATKLQETSNSAESLRDSLSEAAKTAAEFAGIAIGAEAAKELIHLADTAKELDARLRLVTSSEQELASTQQALLQISLSTRTAYEDNVTFFTRLAQSTRDLGIDQATLLRVTQTLNEALQLSGASSVEAKNGLTQLSQGLASGTLRGDDLRSVLEDIPGVAQTMAAGLGVSVGKLRELASEGALTTQDIINALLKQSDAVDQSFAKMPETVGGAITNIKSQILLYVGELDKGTGSTKLLVDGLNTLAHSLDALGDVAEIAAVAGLGKLAEATSARITGAVAAAQAAQAERQAEIELANTRAAGAEITAQMARAELALADAAQASAQASYREAVAAQEAAAVKVEAAAQAAAASQAAALRAQGVIEAEVAALEAQKVATLELAAAEAELAAANEAVARTGLASAVATSEQALAAKAASVANGQVAVAADAYALAQQRATAATSLFKGGMTGLVGTITNVVLAFEAGKAAGDFLYDNFEIVRKAGLKLTEMFVLGAEQARYYADEVSNAFNAPGRAAAEQAHQKRLADIDAILKDMEADAAKTGYNFKDMGNAASEAGQKAATSIGQSKSAAEQLIATLEKPPEQAKKTVDAFDELEKKLKGINEKELSQFAAQAQAGLDAAKQKVAELDAKFESLSGQAFIDFEKANRSAFAQAQEDVKQFGKVIDDVRSAQLAKLGVDATEVRTSVSKAMTDAISSVRDLGKESTTTADEMTAAFRGALAKAQTREDVDALIIALSKVKVAGFDSSAAIVELSNRLNEFPSYAQKIDPVTAALKRLGVTSQQELSAAAAKAQNDFDLISKSGTQSAGVVAEAFSKFADAQLKAAASRGDAQLAVEAAELKAKVATEAESDALDKLIAKYPQLGTAADDAGKKQVAASNAAADAAKKAGKDVEDSSQAGSKAAQTMAQSMDDAAAAAGGIVNVVAQLNQKFSELSGDAGKEWESFISHLGVVGESFINYEDDLAAKLDRFNQKVLDASEYSNSLIDRLNAASGANVGLIRSAENAAKSMSYLDSQTLSALNAAIDGAKQRMDSLDSSAQSTLRDLQDQLDQLEGNTDAIQKRANDAKRAEIEAQLQAAKAAHDQTAIDQLQQALDLLNKVEQVQAQQAKAAADQAAKDQAAAAASTTQQAQTAATSSATTTQAASSSAASTAANTANTQSVTSVVEVRFIVDKNVYAFNGSASTAAAFLAELQQAGAVTYISS